MERARALAERKSVAALADRAPLQDPPFIHATAPPQDTSDQEHWRVAKSTGAIRSVAFPTALLSEKRVYDLIGLRTVARGKVREQKEEWTEKNNPVGRQLQWTWSNTGGERCATRAEHRVEIFPSKRESSSATR
ncbi:hypothetical protein ABG067_006428 [Albugo candida]